MVTLSSSHPCPPFFLELGCWKDCSPLPAPKLCQVPLGCRSSPVFNQLANSLPGVCFRWSPTKSKPSSWAYRVTQHCLYLNDPQPALQVTASLGLPIRPRRLALEVGGTRLPLKELPPGKEEDKRLKWIHTSKANRRENRTFLITGVKEMKMSWPAKAGGAVRPRGHGAWNPLRGGSGATAKACFGSSWVLSGRNKNLYTWGWAARGGGERHPTLIN